MKKITTIFFMVIALFTLSCNDANDRMPEFHKLKSQEGGDLTLSVRMNVNSSSIRNFSLQNEQNPMIKYSVGKDISGLCLIKSEVKNQMPQVIYADFSFKIESVSNGNKNASGTFKIRYKEPLPSGFLDGDWKVYMISGISNNDIVRNGRYVSAVFRGSEDINKFYIPSEDRYTVLDKLTTGLTSSDLPSGSYKVFDIPFSSYGWIDVKRNKGSNFGDVDITLKPEGHIISLSIKNQCFDAVTLPSGLIDLQNPNERERFYDLCPKFLSTSLYWDLGDDAWRQGYQSGLNIGKEINIPSFTDFYTGINVNEFKKSFRMSPLNAPIGPIFVWSPRSQRSSSGEGYVPFIKENIPPGINMNDIPIKIYNNDDGGIYLPNGSNPMSDYEPKYIKFNSYVATPRLLITQVLSKKYTSGRYLNIIEVYNPSVYPVDLSRYCFLRIKGTDNAKPSHRPGKRYLAKTRTYQNNHIFDPTLDGSEPLAGCIRQALYLKNSYTSAGSGKRPTYTTSTGSKVNDYWNNKNNGKVLWNIYNTTATNVKDEHFRYLMPGKTAIFLNGDFYNNSNPKSFLRIQFPVICQQIEKNISSKKCQFVLAVDNGYYKNATPDNSKGGTLQFSTKQAVVLAVEEGVYGDHTTQNPAVFIVDGYAPAGEVASTRQKLSYYKFEQFIENNPNSYLFTRQLMVPLAINNSASNGFLEYGSYPYKNATKCYQKGIMEWFWSTPDAFENGETNTSEFGYGGINIK